MCGNFCIQAGPTETQSLSEASVHLPISSAMGGKPVGKGSKGGRGAGKGSPGGRSRAVEREVESLSLFLAR